MEEGTAEKRGGECEWLRAEAEYIEDEAGEAEDRAAVSEPFRALVEPVWSRTLVTNIPEILTVLGACSDSTIISLLSREEATTPVPTCPYVISTMELLLRPAAIRDEYKLFNLFTPSTKEWLMLVY